MNYKTTLGLKNNLPDKASLENEMPHNVGLKKKNC